MELEANHRWFSRMEIRGKTFAWVEHTLTQTGGGFKSRQMAAMNEWMKKGPLEWQDYIYKEVRVTASEKEYTGWVLTTDPVSAKWVWVLLPWNHDTLSCCLYAIPKLKRQIMKSWLFPYKNFIALESSCSNYGVPYQTKQLCRNETFLNTFYWKFSNIHKCKENGIADSILPLLPHILKPTAGI